MKLDLPTFGNLKIETRRKRSQQTYNIKETLKLQRLQKMFKLFSELIELYI